MGPVATWAVTQRKPPDPPRDDPGHLQAANRVAERHQSRISTAKYGFDTSLVYHGCVISRVICCPLSILTSRQIARDKMQRALTTVGPLIPCRSASFHPRSESVPPPKRIARRHGVEIGKLSTFVRSQPATLHPAPPSPSGAQGAMRVGYCANVADPLAYPESVEVQPPQLRISLPLPR